MKILVVEDDQNMLDFLKMSLEGECYAVDTAKDGTEGLQLARMNNYDLIIMDYLMPGMNGKQLCQTIREEKSVPIIMLTVKTEVSSKIELLDLGADDYLSKPFSFGELCARIRAVLKRPKEMLSPVLQVDDLILDKEGHRVTRNDLEINLTRKEFCLLEFLMRNRGRFVSRGMLIDHVWDMSADPFSNTVEAHITNLRKKLAQPGAKEVIHTKKGIGYKFE